MLYVTMQPKSTLPLTKFHDWYNQEHGPIRLRLPFFTNGIRYQATDLSPSDDTSQKPEWLATYEISDMKHLTEPIYTSLRPNASPREKAILTEIEIGRHLFDLTSDRQVEGYVPIEEADFTVVDGYERKGRILVAVGMTLTALENAEEEVDGWYEIEHIPLLMKIPGWLRTRRFKTSKFDSESPTEYISLHEYENVNGLGGLEHQEAMDTPWRTVIREKYVASGWRRTYSVFYIFSDNPGDGTTETSTLS